MILQITKKLADWFKLDKLPDLAAETNKLYSWRVNIVQEKGFKFLVFMNDASRYTVCVNRPNKKTDLMDLLFKTLRGVMLADNVNPAVIDRYINECGKSQFYRNVGRKETAWLNKATDNSWFAMRNTDESLDISMVASHISVSPYTGAGYDENYRPDERFYALLEVYGLPVRSGKAFDLNVRLDLDGNDAARKLRVSANITFEQLHRILQAAFGWKNSHLHSFGMFSEWSKDRYGYAEPDVELVLSKEDLEYKPTAKLTANITLAEFIPKYRKVLYTYDYGDNWQHYIEVESIIESCPDELPVLLAGNGDAPPEDVGGAGGFADFIRIISNPNDEEYDFNLEWSKSQYWKHFDLETSVRAMRHSLGL